jgi:hypothetical protein
MPFALIPTALGVCFCLVWAFIGGMIFRDSQLAAQQECEFDTNILPLPTRRISQSGPHGLKQAAVRAAS